MPSVNPNFSLLAAGYLFPEIARRTNAYLEKNPGTTILRLGIGNTTLPLTKVIVDAMKDKLDLLSSEATYTGYGDEQGDSKLRQALAEFYKKTSGVDIALDEFFVSDGAKSDAANIQELFSKDSIVAIQDPAYPVYVDSNVVGGRSGVYNESSYSNFVYLESNEENGFVPSVPNQHVDIIYLCFPNNPTGAVASKEQLKEFVDYARREKAIIIFDAAYSSYIVDDNIVKSIYEIEGATECAIELNSFSKNAGFTGVRLGWTIVPKDLVFSSSAKGVLNSMWNRRQCTFFNGACNIAQAGGIAALSDEGQKSCQTLVDYYMDNARIIKEGLESIGLVCYGGVNSPYIWAKVPEGFNSWSFFDFLLEKCGVVVTPGAGFGPSGDNFIRVSSYGNKDNVKKAISKIIEVCK